MSLIPKSLKGRLILLQITHFIIPISVNLLVVIITGVFLSKYQFTPEELELSSWLEVFSNWPLIIFILSFIIPTFIIILYYIPITRVLFSGEPEERIKLYHFRFLNMPFIVSSVSFAGWGIAFLGFFILLTVIHLKRSWLYWFKFFMNNLFMATSCFIFIYYILDLLNQEFVIPKILQKEKLSEIKGSIKLSIRFRFFVYLSTICVTPVLVYLQILLSSTNNAEAVSFYISLSAIIIILSIILTFFISNSFARPILKMQMATHAIQSGEYKIHLPVLSIDEIGFLQEGMNDMAKSLEEKEFMKETFGRVVDPSVRDYLLKGNVSLGGELQDVSILFADIRNFTTLSEKMPPAKVVEWLNLYFEKMSECIISEKGLVNKFIGDAILAVFGSPIPLENHPESSVKAGLLMHKSLKSLNEYFVKNDFPEIKIGIGIHSGRALVGNLGSTTRMEYTVIGDVVNTASRLQTLCKETEKEFLISEKTFSQIKTKSSAKPLDRFKLRGKVEEIQVYYFNDLD